LRKGKSRATPTIVPLKTPLFDFYTKPNAPASYPYETIMKFSLAEMEKNHDYIQYLFPTITVSQYHPSPTLTEQEIQLFKKSFCKKGGKNKFKKALAKMSEFYGFTGTNFRRKPNFPQRSQIWLTPYNHNFMRISRMLESLNLLGFKKEAASFFRALTKLYEDPLYKDVIGKSYDFWRDRANTGKA
jgi:hypothetical protein